MTTTFTDCPDCGSSHLGGSCGLTFRERLLSVKVDPAALETRTKHDYYDAESVAETFGEDAEDRMMTATKGLGPIKRDRHGNLWHRERKSRDIVRAEPHLDTILGADTESSDVDPQLLSDD